MARRKYAVVKQYGRFTDDGKFWTDTLGPEIKLRELDHGENLRFLLEKKEQFEKLRAAIEGLNSDAFLNGQSSTDGENAEADE